MLGIGHAGTTSRNQLIMASLRIVAESTVEGMETHVQAWEELALRAVEPNPFYEHWMLIPAWRHLGGSDVSVVFIYDQSGSTGGTERLSAVFPIVRKSVYRQLPIPYVGFWKHRYCFICTPLVRTESLDSIISEYLDWAGEHWPSWSATAFNLLNGDGPIQKALNRELHRRGIKELSVDSVERAMIVPRGDSAAYLARNLSSSKRKELRRQLNRLSEQGTLTFRELNRAEDVPQWLESFTALEAAGWKGQQGTAIMQNPADLSFFNEAMPEAFKRGRLMMTGLFLNDAPIALKVNFVAEPGAFAFKIAYDERYARYSPGLQLEIDNVHRIHNRPGLEWMDSCADPDHPMIDHLWAERRAVRTTVVPRTIRGSGTIVSLVNVRNSSARLVQRLRKRLLNTA